MTTEDKIKKIELFLNPTIIKTQSYKIFLENIKKLLDININFIYNNIIKFEDLNNIQIKGITTDTIIPLKKLQINIILLFLKKKIPGCNDILRNILDYYNKQINIFNNIATENTENVIDIPSSSELSKIGGTNNNSINSVENKIITKYINKILFLISSPIMNKLTSLGMDEIIKLINDDETQLWNINGPINKENFIKSFTTFIYLNITKLYTDISTKTFNTKYIILNESHIDIDTTNYNKILDNKSNNKYIYIKRFINIINKLLKETEPYYIYIKKIIIEYIKDSEYIVSSFESIHSIIEDTSNTSFQDKINDLIKIKVKNSILTYIKIRNDNGTTYNNRFNVFTNKNDNKDDNTILLVKYNDHNFPYYREVIDKNKKKSISDISNTDLTLTFNTFNTKNKKNEKFDDYFKYYGNDLYINKHDTTYLIGPCSRIFDQTLNNKDIANQLNDVITSLLNNKPIFIIGYGASGAGKTSTLIYFNKGPDSERDGILMNICNIMGNNGYKKLNMKSREFFKRQDTEDIIPRKNDNIPSFNYDTTKQTFMLSKEYIHTNEFNNNPEKDSKGNILPNITSTFTPANTLGQVVIHLIDNDRFVKATTNNPNSSRSHALIFIKLENEETKKTATLIVGDFAGVENLFNCNEPKIIEKFLNVAKDKRNESDPPQRFYSNLDDMTNKFKEQTKGTCDEFVVKNEDLYIFSETTAIRNEKQFTSYPDFFKDTKNYYMIQKMIAKFLIGNDNNNPIDYLSQNFNNDENIKKFPILQKIITEQIQLYKNINTAKDPLLYFINTYMPELKQIIYKRETYKESTEKTTYDKFLSIFEEVIDKLNTTFDEQFTTLFDTFKQNNNINNLSITYYTVNPDKLNNNFYKKYEYIDYDRTQNYRNLTDAEIRIVKNKKLDEYPMIGTILIKHTYKCSNIIEKWKSIFSDNLFSLLNINFNDNMYNNTIIALNKNKNILDNFLIALEIIFNEMNQIIQESSCRINHAKEICNVRRNEGVMINSSLRDIREVIKIILIEKNKNNINITPSYIDACLPFYCKENNCFPLNKTSNKISSAIFNEIKTELKKNSYEELQDLIISVFCVLNLSKAANNPPPVPYINITKIWFAINNNNTCKILGLLKKLLKKINEFDDKIKDFIDGDIYKRIKDISDKSLTVDDIQLNYIREFLEEIDKINAASAIGTLQFVDTVAKFNSTNILCSESSERKYSNTITKAMKFVDIVDNTKQFIKYPISNN